MMACSVDFFCESSSSMMAVESLAPLGSSDSSSMTNSGSIAARGPSSSLRGAAGANGPSYSPSSSGRRRSLDSFDDRCAMNASPRCRRPEPEGVGASKQSGASRY